jgi:hypothetical protein
LAAYAAHANGPAVSGGVDRLSPQAQALYRVVLGEVRASSPAAAPTTDDPAKAAALLSDLAKHGLWGLMVAAATEQQHRLGELPGLAAVAKLLKQRGLLDGVTFADCELGVLTHVLPSLSQLLDVMTREGGLPNAMVRGKGMSSSPFSAVELRRRQSRVDTGAGEGALSPADRAAARRATVTKWLSEANARGRKLLLLGDGWHLAEAAAQASEQFNRSRVGATGAAYVEFTQSGLSFLQRQETLPWPVVSFADSAVKKGCESESLGQWLVHQELDVEQARERPLLPEARQQLHAVVLGHGPVGRGVRMALATQVGRVTVLDPDARALESVDAGEAPKRCRIEASTRPLQQQPVDADLYFVCVGEPGVVDEAVLRAMPDGAVVINCASEGSVDLDFIHRALAGRVAGVRGRMLGEERQVDHRTVELTFDQPPRRLRVRTLGLPLFDGIADKSSFLADVYMSGLLCALCLGAKRLRAARSENRIESLPLDLQREVVALLEETYGRTLDGARAMLAASQR